MAYSDTGREKQSGRHETSLISRYWNPATITAASFTQIFPSLFGCFCDPRARRRHEFRIGATGASASVRKSSRLKQEDAAVLLYLPKCRAYRFDSLAALGAPMKAGVFETSADPRDVLHRVADHAVALVDPVPWYFVPSLWWALRRTETGFQG